MRLIIVLALFGYVLYILLFRHLIIRKKYLKDKVGIPLPEGLDPITLSELLIAKNFNYPEMKNIRHNELGQVVIEGKNTSHALVIKDGILYIERGIKGLQGKQTKCITEAVIIGHYYQSSLTLIRLWMHTRNINTLKEEGFNPLFLVCSSPL